jgi:hypothetical protein
MQVGDNDLALRSAPHRASEALLCFFVAAERHTDRLGDFEEKFRTIWHPRFGWFANVIYCAPALRSAAGMLRIAAWGAAVDRIIRAFHSS